MNGIGQGGGAAHYSLRILEDHMGAMCHSIRGAPLHLFKPKFLSPFLPFRTQLHLKTQPTDTVTVTITSSDDSVVSYAEAVEGVITFSPEAWFQDQTVQLNDTGRGSAVLTLTGSVTGDYNVADTIQYFRSPRMACDRDEGVTDPYDCECPEGVPVKCADQFCSSSTDHCSFIQGTTDQSNMDPGRYVWAFY